jgi:hypothetical protein
MQQVSVHFVMPSLYREAVYVVKSHHVTFILWKIKEQTMQPVVGY